MTDKQKNSQDTPPTEPSETESPQAVTPEAPAPAAPVSDNPHAYREVAEGVEARVSTQAERLGRQQIAANELAAQN